MFVSFRTAAATAAVASLLAFAMPAATLADAMAGSAMKPDCATADSMMMSGHAMGGSMSSDHAMAGGAMSGDHAMGAMKPSGNLDKDFAATASSHMQAMIAMAKTELACGKDAKTKAAAQKVIDNSQQALDLIKEIQGTP